MTDTNKTSTPLNLRKDTSQAIADVEKRMKGSLTDFQQEVDRIAQAPRIKALDGGFQNLGSSARIFAKASIRAEVASMIEVLTKKDGQTDEELVAVIAQQAIHATSESMNVIKLNVKQNSDPSGHYLGFDEFAEYEHVVKVAEWRKYLGLIIQ